MNTKTEMQIAKEIELARLFEVEELEERMEFGRWTASAGTSTSPSTGTTFNTTVSWSSK